MVAASAPPYAPQLQVLCRGERSFQHSGGGLSTGLGVRGRSAFPVWDCTQRAEYQPWHLLSKEERAEKLQWVREPRTASPLSLQGCPLWGSYREHTEQRFWLQEGLGWAQS